jgi:hypothetical protein
VVIEFYFARRHRVFHLAVFQCQLSWFLHPGVWRRATGASGCLHANASAAAGKDKTRWLLIVEHYLFLASPPLTMQFMLHLIVDTSRDGRAWLGKHVFGKLFHRVSPERHFLLKAPVLQARAWVDDAHSSR